MFLLIISRDLHKVDSYHTKSKHKLDNHLDDLHSISPRPTGISNTSFSNQNKTMSNLSSDTSLKKSDKKNSNFFGARVSNYAPNNKYISKSTISSKLLSNDSEKSRMPKIIKQHSSNNNLTLLDDNYSTGSQLSKSQGYYSNTSQNALNDFKQLRRSSIESNATSGYHSNDKKSKNSQNSRTISTHKVNEPNANCNKAKSTFSESSNYFTSANKLKSRNTLKHCRHSSLDTDDHSMHYNQYNHKKRNSVSDEKLLAGNMSSQQHQSYDSSTDLSSQIYIESRLKCLEDSIKKHQNDMKSFLSQNPRVRGKVEKTKPLKVLSEAKIVRSDGRGDLIRSKSEHARTENFVSSSKVKYDHTHAEGDAGKYKTTKRSSNYGVITASDLFKLRTTEMIL